LNGFDLSTSINIIIVLFLLLLLNLTFKAKNIQPLAAILHAGAFSAFMFFWINYGGFAGTVPAFMCVYFAFIIALSSGVYQIVTLAVFSIALAVLLFFPGWLNIENNFDLGKISSFQRNLDYCVIALVIMFFSVYLKNQFLFYKKRVATKYTQLHQIASTLFTQNEVMNRQQEELKSINENLESIIHERTKEIEKKNKDLSEYAFINAHMLRGPLSRVIGLASLMEQDPNSFHPEELVRIKKLANEIDQVVRKINDVVS
jgi:signal transduction histidine kinase